jgi:hypothetical protein
MYCREYIANLASAVVCEKVSPVFGAYGDLGFIGTRGLCISPRR